MVSWLTGSWINRQSHVISKSTSDTGGAAGTNYQIKLKIHSDSGTTNATDMFLNSTAQHFPYDIDITSSDGTTQLKFFVEDATLNPIVVWIKVSGDLGNVSGADQTIYVYWNNTVQTTSLEDGTNTFLMFDDFLTGTTLNSSNWTNYTYGSGAVSVDATNSRAVLTVHPNVSNDIIGILSVFTATNGFAWMIRRKQASNEGYYISHSIGSGDAYNTTSQEGSLKNGYFARYYYKSSTNNDNLSLTNATGVLTSLNSTTYDASNHALYKTWELGYSLSGALALSLDHATAVQTATNTAYLANNNKFLSTQGSYASGAVGAITYVDWIACRKYVDTEPLNSATWGSVETLALTISGVTRDSAGAILVSCSCYLYRISTWAYIGTTTSDDTTGVYSFTIHDYDTYFVVSFKTGSPNVMGTTDKTLVGS